MLKYCPFLTGNDDTRERCSCDDVPNGVNVSSISSYSVKFMTHEYHLKPLKAKLFKFFC